MKELLLKHQAVLSHARYAGGFRKAVIGQFKDRDAEFGIGSRKDEAWLYFQVKLHHKVKVPKFLMGVCPLDGHGTVCLRQGIWVRYQKNGYREEVEVLLKDHTENSMREKFEELAATSERIEQGAIDLQEIFAKQWEVFSGQLSLVAFFLAIAAVSVWVWWINY